MAKTAKMTKEDAVEVILQGNPYVQCRRCRENTTFGRPVLRADCVDCKGWGKVPSRRYVKACAVLGKPAPEPMHVVQERNLDNVRVGGPPLEEWEWAGVDS